MRSKYSFNNILFFTREMSAINCKPRLVCHKQVWQLKFTGSTFAFTAQTQFVFGSLLWHVKSIFSRAKWYLTLLAEAFRSVLRFHTWRVIVKREKVDLPVLMQWKCLIKDLTFSDGKLKGNVCIAGNLIYFFANHFFFINYIWYLKISY